ncbi:MAG: hypothetical protein MPJ24_11045 [Pirellulaceae bacterium]|nr:hypothetical protein [Pirellulaceae bacterium]
MKKLSPKEKRLFFVAVGLGAPLLIIALTWAQWREAIFVSYRLSGPDDLVLSDKPDWIPDELTENLFRQGKLEGTNLYEKGLLQKIGQLASLEPWVKEVKKVEKGANKKIVLHLLYRKPVAMVKVTSGEKRGLLPIDREGVLLPIDGFTEEEIEAYPRLIISDLSLAQLTGKVWDDIRVVQSATLAGSLVPYWKELGLYQIIYQETTEELDSTYELILADKKSARVIWGVIESEEKENKKIETLLKYIKEEGPLKELAAPLRFDS